ncbi:MAG: DUF1499 domain-containing protein [Denitromonas halophila]|nr:MAG: DUF1499 domain-containing protein [Denitromonas halophila]TVT74244.1 MAG: DUF1499 domain-containing protein [Denitromonas halophila]TVT77171.1 MAG: DUF1499 domain-containing protein [Denitromonas halophila]
MSTPSLAAIAFTLMTLTSPALAATPWQSCSGPPVADAASELLPCTDRPNCVSTEHPADERRITPPQGLSFEALRKASLAEPRSQIVAEGPTWFIAHFRSRLFGFVDEAHVIQRADGQLAVRSGACSGYSDFGVNRARLLRIFTRASGGNRLE